MPVVTPLNETTETVASLTEFATEPLYPSAITFPSTTTFPHVAGLVLTPLTEV